ncbi:MAG: DUF1127 domain-containing protein [Pseudomonadota bacterium]|nr:DUF1127 domain-containing protein [Pseudomonadota bacterium]MEE3098835.1 DUF1127 domain-containing protein [Pseudomonadota bacterium]
MANMTVNAPALPRGAVLIHSIVCAAEALVDAARVWNARRRTSMELSKLSRSQLADIGLEGVDLDDFAARLRR